MKIRLCSAECCYWTRWWAIASWYAGTAQILEKCSVTLCCDDYFSL